MRKHTILFLAANPVGTDSLALDREARAIQAELERSGFRDSFEFVTRWAAEPLDLLRELRKLKPTVVHFSGHGGARHTRPGTNHGPRRGGLPQDSAPASANPAEESVQEGLFFADPNGRPQFVSTEAVQATFGAAGSTVKLVVLSACFSAVQAKALLAHVDCVVGMRGAILDDAARSFAIGFYGGLGERESTAAAYQQGCAAISLQGLPDAHLPQLLVRDGVKADHQVLAAAGISDSADSTREGLLTWLSRLLPSQFEEVLFRARIPTAHLPGTGAPQAIRAMDAIRYLEQRNQLDQLIRLRDDLATGSS